MDVVVAPVRSGHQRELVHANTKLTGKIGGEHEGGFVEGVAVADLLIICI